MTRKKIIVINPGSTSTKIAVFEDDNLLWQVNLTHTVESLAGFDNIWQQYEFRRREIADYLKQLEFNLAEVDAVVGRGGLLRPIAGGTYAVNEQMLQDAHNDLQGAHVSNLGCALAAAFAREAGCPAFIVDPVSVDEFDNIARYSGHPEIERRSLSHSLNLHAAARKAANELGKDYLNSNFIVIHLGSGISIAPIKNGRIIDVNDASSDGPFSPDRTGGLPLQQFIELCFSGKYNEKELKKLVMGNGGLVAYLGTNDLREVENRVQNGDARAREIFRAMAYQIAKEIGAMATVLAGKLEAIILTGGGARSKMLTNWIGDSVSFIASVLLFPGEFEMEAMASGALRVLRGDEQIKEY